MPFHKLVHVPRYHFVELIIKWPFPGPITEWCMRFSFFNILSLYRLCQSKQSKVYLPEAPFPHAEVFYVLRRLRIVNKTLAIEDGRGFDRNVLCFLIVVYSYRICNCGLFFQQLVKTGRLKHFPSIHGEWKGDIWNEETFSRLLLETLKEVS